jgi:hypothetical protein
VSRLEDPIASIPCEVQLPADWQRSSQDNTLFACRPEDNRRFPRRGLTAMAALQYRQTLPVLQRPNRWHRIYLVNLSRGGLAFLHSEQLFPREQMHVLFPGGEDRLVEVARCRRINDKCFEIGVSFAAEAATSPEPSDAESQPASPTQS